MARKSKRMALNEAIRQGQAKIAKGLESGQLRSDGPAVGEKPSQVPDKPALFRSKEAKTWISVPFKTKVVPFSVLGVVLLAVIWLVFRSDGTDNPQVTEETPQQQTSPGNIPGQPEKTVAAQQDDKEDTGFFGFGKKKTDDKPDVQENSQETLPAGANVIVIQQIPSSQKEKLASVQEYFNARGVTTVMMERSGYGLLVTKAGFDYNPNREGTEGYRLMQRIKQLGLAYPDETGDTKFGIKPFQDAYPLKK